MEKQQPYPLHNLNPNDVFGDAPFDTKSNHHSDTGSTAAIIRAERTTASTSYLSHNWPFIYWVVKFVLIVGGISGLLIAPVHIYRNAEVFEEHMTEVDVKNRVSDIWLFNVFLFLLITWLGTAVMFLVATALPYVFRFVARYVASSRSQLMWYCDVI